MYHEGWPIRSVMSSARLSSSGVSGRPRVSSFSSSAIMSATRIGLCHLLAGAKHLDLGQAQVVCAGELHANIPAIRTGGSDGGGGIGNRGLMALPGSGPFL